MDGVPTGKPDSWRSIGHDMFKVVQTPLCVDSWPAREVPLAEPASDSLQGVVNGLAAENFVNQTLPLFFPCGVVFFREWELCLLGECLSNVVLVDVLGRHLLFVVVKGGGHMVVVPIVVLARPAQMG